MDYTPGESVQAVDELGRWENATVRKCGDHDDHGDDSQVEVTFDGWDSSFNRVVGGTEIRRRVDPGSGELFFFDLFLSFIM